MGRESKKKTKRQREVVMVLPGSRTTFACSGDKMTGNKVLEGTVYPCG
jgi:hypothetical protein